MKIWQWIKEIYRLCVCLYYYRVHITCLTLRPCECLRTVALSMGTADSPVETRSQAGGCVKDTHSLFIAHPWHIIIKLLSLVQTSKETVWTHVCCNRNSYATPGTIRDSKRTSKKIIPCTWVCGIVFQDHMKTSLNEFYKLSEIWTWRFVVEYVPRGYLLIDHFL